VDTPRNSIDKADEAQLLATIDRWVEREVAPRVKEFDHADRWPAEIVEQMKELGLFGATVSPEYGGLGLPARTYAEIVMKVSSVWMAITGIFNSHLMLALAVEKFGTEPQRRHWLPRLASGEVRGGLALTEPDAGTDLQAIRLTARREGDHYVLNGTKCFITNAPIAGLFTVMARTDPEDLSARGVTAFLVERGMPGLSTGPAYKKMGQAGSPVSEVHMDNCIVPVENVIGGREGQGFKTAMKVLNKQRIHLAALCIGPAIRMLQDALTFVATRKQFGQTLSSFQLVQALIADSQTEIHAARALVLDTARKRDEGIDVTMEASICKYFASEMCGRVADRSVQMLGGYGYIADHGMERFYRDVRLFRLYEGTSQIQQIVIARHLVREATR